MSESVRSVEGAFEAPHHASEQPRWRSQPLRRALARPHGALRASARAVARVPRAGRICFAITFVNAAIWGTVVPPFQVPDEVSHFAYVQYLAESGEPPLQRAEPPYSQQEQSAIELLDVGRVIGFGSQRGIFDAAESEAAHDQLAIPESTTGAGGSNASSNQPPLYYALESIPYLLSPSHELLFRLVLMRLLSALIAAFTALTVFLFIRELLPRTRWAWTVGALVVAFQPTFDFIAAGVNGDNLLFFTSTLTCLALLRAYRRGFTAKRGAGIGLAVAAGTLAKITFIALLPGIALAILLLGWRTLPEGRRIALRSLALTVLVAAAPVALYALMNVAVWHRGGGISAGAIAGATNNNLPGGGVVTWHETLDYIWQLYLPRLWFMNHAFFTEGQLIHTWFDGAIGHFGWLDYGFPPWVYSWAKDLFIGLVGLALVGLWRLRSGARELLPLFACYGVSALGLMAAIGYDGVRYQASTGEHFAQARYLFPLIAFYALFVVVAAHAPRRRWAPVLGALLVVLAMTHGLFAETLTISRYYG